MTNSSDDVDAVVAVRVMDRAPGESDDSDGGQGHGNHVNLVQGSAEPCRGFGAASHDQRDDTYQLQNVSELQAPLRLHRPAAALLVPQLDRSGITRGLCLGVGRFDFPDWGCRQLGSRLRRVCRLAQLRYACMQCAQHGSQEPSGGNLECLGLRAITGSQGRRHLRDVEDDREQPPSVGQVPVGLRGRLNDQRRLTDTPVAADQIGSAASRVTDGVDEWSEQVHSPDEHRPVCVWGLLVENGVGQRLVPGGLQRDLDLEWFCGRGRHTYSRRLTVRTIHDDTTPRRLAYAQYAGEGLVGLWSSGRAHSLA